MTAHIRQWFWLLVMDAIAAWGGFGSRLYLWAVGKASATVDCSDVPPCEGREPF